jgi:hypothetical protein
MFIISVDLEDLFSYHFIYLDVMQQYDPFEQPV